MHSKMIILLDLDDTVLGPNMTISPTLVNALEATAAAGALLGWASYTSDKGLRAWERQMGIPEDLLPIRVSEDGAYITAPLGVFTDSHDGRSRISILTGEERWSNIFRNIREEVMRKAREAKWGLVETHPATWAMNTTSFSPIHPAMVAVDVTRRSSFTCEVRGIARGDPPGQLLINSTHTNTVKDWVRRAAKKHGISGNRVNTGNGWVDLGHPTASKSAAIAKLQEALPDRPIYMIGNGKNDIVELEGVHLVAVGNACPALKDVADTTTQANYSAGVIEFLESLHLEAR